MSPNIDRIVVAGGGIVAWSVAAALRRHIPSQQVTVVSCPVPADAIADRMISTLPSIAGFHADLGLSDSDTILGAQSGLRIGTLFEGWSAGLRPYVHAYGTYGASVEGIPFHQLWLRARAEGGVEEFDRYSAGAELGRMGRIGSSAASNGSAAEVGYGLHLTPERYRALMRDYARHLGALEQPCRAFEPRLRGDDGFVDALLLDDGVTVAGDLFVDCTGPAAWIRSALDDRFEKWRSCLPCDRMIFAEGQPNLGAPLLDRITADPAGWRWEASSPSRSSRGALFSSAHGSGDEVARQFVDSIAGATEITIDAGRWSDPWLRNCVAIGDAAVTIEPLEWANLHLAHSQIDRLISMMPGRDCAPVELAEYNRQCNIEAERVRDFACMHYLTARREEPFWRDASSIEPPASLAHTLALFAERGRLPYYEEETFSRDSWAAVLLGQGFEPRGTDPLADSVPLDRVRLELRRYADSLRGFVEAQPLYADYMSNLIQQSAR